MTTAGVQTLDIVQIEEILPRRYPFLLVDRVREMVPGRKAEGNKNLTENEEFFNVPFKMMPIETIQMDWISAALSVTQRDHPGPVLGDN
jgi:hypothetical protein